MPLYNQNILKTDINKLYMNNVKKVYDMYMSFFDNETDIDELYKNEKINKNRYSHVVYLIKRFIVNFQDYAKDNYGIEDLEKYVLNSKLFKKCYENYIKYIEGNISVGEYLSNIENAKIDILSYRKIVQNYAEEVLNMSKIDIEELMNKGNHIKKTLELIESISDENEIFSVLTGYGRYKDVGIENGNYRIRNLKGYVFDYVVVKYQLDKKELDIKVNSLKEKILKVINLYNGIENNVKKEQQKNDRKNYIEEISKRSIDLITEFISKDMSINVFLREKGVSKQEFYDALTSISEHAPNLYKKYNDYIDEKTSQMNDFLETKVDLIVDLIKNGIVNEETNVKKEFDILDYYMNINLSPGKFLDIAKNKYKGNDLILIRTFFSKNRTRHDEEKIIMDAKYIINSVEITNEIKEQVINYLKQINAPISTNVFKIALRRHLKNELIIEETNKKSR